MVEVVLVTYYTQIVDISLNMSKLRYSDYYEDINIDAFEEAIGFEPLETLNDNDVGYCVFPENHSHGDTTGKFAIHRDKKIYNCWACGGGSLLSLAMELYDFDIDEATEWVYQFCEADMRTDQEFVDEFLDAFRDVQHRIETLPYFNERVLEQFGSLPEDEWLKSRGISVQTAEAYKIGYANPTRRPSPGKGRYAEEEDYWGPAVVFPHFWKGRLVGWQSRWLDEDRPDWVPKYTMTGDFPKDSTIYGFDDILDSWDPDRKVLVVESVPSALFAVSCGFPAVATFGSNVNEAQMRLLRRFNRVMLCPDNDPAGAQWARGLYSYLIKYTRIWIPPAVEWDKGDIGDFPAHCDDSKQALSNYYNSAQEIGPLNFFL